MWDRAFANRLRKELPAWTERGLVAPAQADAILAHAEVRAARTDRLTPVALGVLGALIFATGVILFFAANWDAMSKIVKLTVLFAGLWAAYATALWGSGRQGKGARVLGQAALLLGVLLFGANIHLIAQIYHIDAHYPNGVLMWAVGALALCWAAPSQPVATAGFALTVVWSGMESLEFWNGVHWPFLPLWAAFLPPALQRGWRWTAAVALLALFAWLLITLEAVGHREKIYAVQLYVLVGIAIYALGHECADHRRVAPLAVIVQRFGLVGALLAAHGMLYTELHGLHWEYGWAEARRLPMAPTWWIVATVLAAVTVIALVTRRLLRAPGAAGDPLGRAGLALAVLAIAALLSSLLAPPSGRAVGAVYVGWNLVHAAALVWLVLRGYARGDRFQVNAAFLFLGLGVLALYFDRFWSLMDRSLFFMGGGAILVVGGFALERQRRRLTARMAGGDDGSVA